MARELVLLAETADPDTIGPLALTPRTPEVAELECETARCNRSDRLTTPHAEMPGSAR